MNVSLKFLPQLTGWVKAELEQLVAAIQTGWNTEHTLEGTHGDISVNSLSGAGWFDPRAYGAVGDGVTDDTVAVQAAIRAATDAGGVLFLPAGRFKLMSVSGGFALTVSCPVVGVGRQSCLYNAGTGSALLFFRTYSPLYYESFRNFSVEGNTDSEDGIVLSNAGTAGNETAYCRFSDVDSFNHGRHGLVHRMAWATRYTDCQFYQNGGLGVYVNRVVSDTGGANTISFLNCAARWNGGLGDVGSDYLHGGVRITESTGVLWMGGAVESNNAWGFIIGHSTDYITRNVHVKHVFMEDNPKATATSSVGGNFRVAEQYLNVTVQDSHLDFGATSGKTGYCFYVANPAESGSHFKESGNLTSDLGLGGTEVRDYGIQADWTHEYVSKQLGDIGQTSTPAVHTILSTQATGTWVIGGTIYCKKNSDNTGGVYPWIAGQDTDSGDLKVSVGSAVAGSATTAPTMAWDGGDLELTFDGDHYGYVTMSIGGAQNAPPSIFSLPTGIWTADLVRRSSPE